ncbi:hypothetical protein BV898_02835 [Hypsibius exemplaris]|uniref:Uncharacterized protein n=1 Tax=Hypsibius exemplaris TaxID=2072580 RepID=A0A1W0X772_HYPEX|nr:hypothetical protein BV898_02835 [Hypsibius exemplaris]
MWCYMIDVALLSYDANKLSRGNDKFCISENYAGQCEDDENPACSQSCKDESRSGGNCGPFKGAIKVCYCDGCPGTTVATSRQTTRRPFSRTTVGSTMSPLLEEVLQRSFDQQKPVFLMKEISPETCTNLDTDSCEIYKKKDHSNNCESALFAYCSPRASNFETTYFFRKVGRLNAGHGLGLNLGGERSFTKKMFEPIADILISLDVYDFPHFSTSLFSAASVKLAILQELGIYNCQSIEIQRDDFLAFPSLRVLKFYGKSTIASIEENAFDSLMYLRHITFEEGFNTLSELSPELRNHLSLLHCSPNYKWLRDWLQLRPYLLTPIEDGEVISAGGLTSSKVLKENIFVPVDCASSKLIAENTDGPFSSAMNM